MMAAFELGTVTGSSGVLVLGMAGWIDYWPQIGGSLAQRAAVAARHRGGHLRDGLGEAIAARASTGPLVVRATASPARRGSSATSVTSRRPLTGAGSRRGTAPRPRMPPAVRRDRARDRRCWLRRRFATTNSVQPSEELVDGDGQGADTPAGGVRPSALPPSCSTAVASRRPILSG